MQKFKEIDFNPSIMSDLEQQIIYDYIAKKVRQEQEPKHIQFIPIGDKPKAQVVLNGYILGELQDCREIYNDKSNDPLWSGFIAKGENQYYYNGQLQQSYKVEFLIEKELFYTAVFCAESMDRDDFSSKKFYAFHNLLDFETKLLKDHKHFSALIEHPKEWARFNEITDVDLEKIKDETTVEAKAEKDKLIKEYLKLSHTYNFAVLQPQTQPYN